MARVEETHLGDPKVQKQKQKHFREAAKLPTSTSSCQENGKEQLQRRQKQKRRPW
jgi:hypothetical protein